jgi:hypothetical protein
MTYKQQTQTAGSIPTKQNRQTSASQPSSTNLPTTPVGLTYAEETYHDPLVVVTSGPPGCGKSHLGATAPGLGLIPTESKSRGTVIKDAAKQGLRVKVPNQDIIRVTDPMLIATLPNTCIVSGDKRYPKSSDIQEAMQEIAEQITLDGPPMLCCKRHYYRWHVNRVKRVAYLMLEDPEIRVIMFDTFGQFVDDVSYANYGLTGVIDPSEFGFAPRQDMNEEIRSVLNVLCRKHLILTHHQKDVWRDGKPTKQKKPSSQFSGLGHYATVQVEQYRRGQYGWWEQAGYEDSQYQLKVVDCQQNASLIRPEPLLYDGDISFGTLAMMVYPDAADGEFD